MGHSWFGLPLERQQGMSRGELRVSWDQNGWQDRAFNSLIVVGVDAYFLLFGAKGVLADLEGLQLVVTLQVGPAPDAAVDDVWEALTVRYLELERCVV